MRWAALLCGAASWLAVSTTAASAGGSYSIAEANRYVRAQDWNGLYRYVSGWTRDAPDDSMGWYYLGNTLSTGLGRWAEAAEAYRRTTALKPDWPEAWHALGHVEVELKRFGDAAAAFRHAVDLAPERPTYWNNLAVAYAQLGQYDRALDALASDARLAAPHGTWLDWYVLGNGLDRLGEPADAVGAYRQALRLNPRSGEVWNNLGAAQQELGNAGEALRDYRQAAALGNPLGGENFAALQRALAAAAQARAAASAGGGGAAPGGGGAGAPAASSGGGCAYGSYAACNAARNGDYWAADRIENNSASGSEQSWYDR